MNTFIKIISIFVLINLHHAYPQVFQWAMNSNAVINSNAKGVDYDAAGNSYVTGSFVGPINFGSYNLNSSNSYEDIYLTKINSAGVTQWAVKAGGADFDEGYNIATDAAGNSYVTGYFEGVATFGNYTLTSAGGMDVFVAKYNSSGTVLWAKQAGDTSADIGRDIDIDNSGNCYVTGTFGNIAYFGNNMITSNGEKDVFVAKYNSSGILQWVKSGGAQYDDIVKGINVDNSGNIYITGNFGGNATYGSVNFSSVTVDMFLVKYNSSGIPVWGLTAGGNLLTGGNGVSTDASGNCYVSGYFSGLTNFSSNFISPTGNTNMFIVKYSPSGNFIWIKNTVSSFANYGYNLSTDPAGNSYVCGWSSGNSDFGNGVVLTTPYAYNLFVVKYNSLGIPQYVKLGIFYNQFHTDISADAFGNVYVCGAYFGWFNTATFDSHVIIDSQTGYESYITRIVMPPKLALISCNLEVLYPVFTVLSVYLRRSSSPYEVLDSGEFNANPGPAGYFINSEFRNVTESDSFYVVIKHRNCLETWSSGFVKFDHQPAGYDFTSSLDQAYGSNMKDVNGIPSIYTGEINNDGTIDVSDLVAVYNDAIHLEGGNIITDLNGDEYVDVTDVIAVYNNAVNVVSIARP